MVRRYVYPIKYLKQNILNYGWYSEKYEGDLLFLGDPSHGRPYNLEVWHVSIVPTGDIGLITEEWVRLPLK